ncbi:MAG: beta-1,6-N-acetylglucosaminyltransferase, partial [Pseudomonadota bacterium]
YLASGACLPLRPVEELIEYLADRPRTDFIESATTADVPWTVGGLDEERFTMRFPFSWKRQRFLFDKFVALQRQIGLKRRIPKGLVPHMGSQWWCLTRQTLTAILQGPERREYDNYFRHVWIPDESYYQTLARQFSTNIESRSLTLSKFDFQGKPHMAKIIVIFTPLR